LLHTPTVIPTLSEAKGRDLEGGRRAERDSRAAPAPRSLADALDDGSLEQRVLDYLRTHGASFFAQIQAALGGFANDLVDAMWDLVWKGLLTNDTFHALRAQMRPKSAPRKAGFRSRRVAPPSTQGRWSLIPPP